MRRHSAFIKTVEYICVVGRSFFFVELYVGTYLLLSTLWSAGMIVFAVCVTL